MGIGKKTGLKQFIIGIVAIVFFSFIQISTTYCLCNIEMFGMLMKESEIYEAAVNAINRCSNARYLTLSIVESDNSTFSVPGTNTVVAESKVLNRGEGFAKRAEITKHNVRGRATLYNSASPYSGVAETQFCRIR